MRASTTDTIIAISSPPGRSMRGLIRLAGPRAFEVLDCLLDDQTNSGAVTRPQSDRDRVAIRPSDRTLIPTRLRSPNLPVLIARFPGPSSYTGNDVAELQLPGNPALLDRVVRDGIGHGARLAEPGEFTFRAFLTGRMDLTRAEGVAATIAATSDSQLAAARLLRQGRLGSFATGLVDRLGQLLALVEAGIDFTDQEDVVPITPRKLDEGLHGIETDLRQLLEHSRSWGALEALPRVVLAGPPSSGKSTLFNALLGHDRAVIHDQPGTTRDMLEEPLRLIRADGRRVEVMLVDIAGLDEAEALLDREAQRIARDAIARADLVIRLTPVGEPGSRPSIAGFAPADGMAMIDVYTMADRKPGRAYPEDTIAISAITGQGLSGLRAAIVRRIGKRGVSLAGDMLALQPRHAAALREAAAGLSSAREALSSQRDARALNGIEWIAAALRDSLDALASLGGELTPDDIIGRVFATFCVGK